MANKEVAKSNGESKGKVNFFEEDDQVFGELTSAYIGGASPFGQDVTFPMQRSNVIWEYSPPVPPRILDDERH